MVHIFKKALILILALGFSVCSHLRPSCDFTVSGELVSAGCTPSAADRAKAAALAAAEEILPGGASLPEYKTKLRFTLYSSEDSAPQFSDALLRATPGVILGDGVYVDGKSLGTVADSRAFRAELGEYIDNTMPSWACTGSLGGYLEFRPQYTRAEYEIPVGDMIMLVTGLSPVMYTDGNGRVSPV